jgi:hypothetical protein
MFSKLYEVQTYLNESTELSGNNGHHPNGVVTNMVNATTIRGWEPRLLRKSLQPPPTIGRARDSALTKSCQSESIMYLYNHV